MKPILLKLSDFYTLNEEDLNLILTLFKVPSKYLETENKHKKLFDLNLIEEYDNSGENEASWVENTGTLYYYVSVSNLLCCKDESQTDIDFYHDYNILIYHGYLYPSQQEKIEDWEKVNFCRKEKNNFFFDNKKYTKNQLFYKLAEKKLAVNFSFNYLDTWLIKFKSKTLLNAYDGQELCVKIDSINKEKLNLVYSCSMSSDFEYYFFYDRIEVTARSFFMDINVYSVNKEINSYLITFDNFCLFVELPFYIEHKDESFYVCMINHFLISASSFVYTQNELLEIEKINLAQEKQYEFLEKANYYAYLLSEETMKILKIESKHEQDLVHYYFDNLGKLLGEDFKKEIDIKFLEDEILKIKNKAQTFAYMLKDEIYTKCQIK